MTAMTMMPGATIFMLSVTVPPLSDPTTSAPAAMTSRKVLQHSENRRH